MFPYVTASLLLPTRFYVRPFFYSYGARDLWNVWPIVGRPSSALVLSTDNSPLDLMMKIFHGPRLSLDVGVDVCMARLVVTK